MKNKSGLVVVIVVLSVLVGFLGGYILSDKLINKETNNEVTNNGNGNNQNNGNQPQQERVQRIHVTSLEENLKGNNINYKNPLVNGKLVFDSSKMTKATIELDSKTISITKKDNKVILKNSDNKEISFDAEVIDVDMERVVQIYSVNNMLYVNSYLNAGSFVGVYDSSFNNYVENGIDEMALPLLTDNYVYYGLRDCSGPSEMGNVAVYRVNINTKAKEFLFYLDHLAGWTC